MSEMIKNFLILFFLLTVGVAWQVQAHQQKEAISTVLFNARTGNIEVSHRFYIHDAEHAIKQILDKSADLTSQSQTQTAFAEYVERHFSMKLNNEPALPLRLLGQEVKGKFFWVYQEIPFSEKPMKLKVSFNALMDIWEEQRNIVNIEGLGVVRSVELYSVQQSKTIEF